MIKLKNIAGKARTNSNKISEDIIYRWSPRKMSGKVLPEAILAPLFEAASYAPSAYNEQPWRFYYAARGSESFAKLLTFMVPFNQEWSREASFLVVVVSRVSFSTNGKPNPTHSFDTGAAWEALAIEGTLRNLVVHGMSGFNYESVHAFLNLTSDFAVECMLAVGEPLSAVVQESVSTRKEVKDFVTKLD